MKNRNDLKGLDNKYVNGEYFKGIYGENPILYIIFLRLYDLYYIVGSANTSLINATNENLDITNWDIDKSDETFKRIIRTFLRGEHLKHCILSYNSIEDYMLQIITFGLGLKIRYKEYGKYKYFDYSKITKKEFENKKKRRRNMKRIKYNSVKSALENLLKISKSEGSEKYKKILEEMENYNNNEDIERIRELSNQQKHNNSISFKELPSPTEIKYKSDKFCTEWINPERIGLDDSIDMCYRVNIIVKNYVETIYELLELDKYN